MDLCRKDTNSLRNRCYCTRVFIWLNSCRSRARGKATTSRKSSCHPLRLSQAPCVVEDRPVHPHRDDGGPETPRADPLSSAGADRDPVCGFPVCDLDGQTQTAVTAGQAWGLGWRRESGGQAGHGLRDPQGSHPRGP